MSGIAEAPGPQPLEAPRAAAIAGVIFSVLMIIGLGLVRYAIPADLRVPGAWLIEPNRRNAIGLALYLVPFAGIAFLWFLGVLRSRMGELEDQFFATVFLGSGLLFVASMFVAAAVTGALIESVEVGNISSETYYFGRGASDALLNLFAMKMAGVFMVATCTIGLRIAIIPRWVALIGYACALVLVLVIANWRWITLVFPVWMFLVGTHILLTECRSRHASRACAEHDPF
ncbi:MAG: hypothetical protein ACREQC_14000 [Candidatus Binataceae bacterium]